MPSKKSKKASKAIASNKKPTTDLNSPAALENFRDILRFHGERPRGSDFHPSSTRFEGRFARMFRTLPAAEFAEEDLTALAAAMIAAHPTVPTPATEDDDEENQGISAG